MFISNTSDSTTTPCHWLLMVIMIANKPNPEFYFVMWPLRCFGASSTFYHSCGFNLSRVRSFTCHHHRLVPSPERAVSTWHLTFMRHPSDAETGRRQTTRVCAHWDGGEESTVFRDAGRARRGQDRGGDGGEGNTLMNIHDAWASSCAAYQLIKGLIWLWHKSLQYGQ